MNIKTLIDTIVQAVATDEAVAAWCLTYYERQQTVYVNIDEANLPGDDGCPFVAVWPGSKEVGSVERIGHTVDVVACIYDSASRTHTGIDNIVEYQGVARIEELRKLVETAIVGISWTGVTLSRIDIEYDTISDFPYLFAGMSVELKAFRTTIGGDHFA